MQYAVVAVFPSGARAVVERHRNLHSAQAADAAGVGCFLWNLWGIRGYVFPVHGVGQANQRTAAAEAMQDRLRAVGYDTGMYYAAD